MKAHAIYTDPAKHWPSTRRISRNNFYFHLAYIVGRGWLGAFISYVQFQGTPRIEIERS